MSPKGPHHAYYDIDKDIIPPKFDEQKSNPYGSLDSSDMRLIESDLQKDKVLINKPET